MMPHTSSLFGQKQSPPPQLCWFISSEVFLAKIIFEYQWHTQEQLTFTWHGAQRAGERTILSQLRALQCFGAPNQCPAVTALREIQTAENSQSHCQALNVLSAGDCPPLLEEASSAIPGTGLCPPAPVMPSLCPWETQLLVAVGSEDCQGAWPGLHLPGEQNTWLYRTNCKDSCCWQKTTSLGESSLLGCLGPG